MVLRVFSYLIFTFSFICFSAVAEPAYIGTIKALQGKVSIQLGSTIVDAQLNDKVYEGYLIDTEDNSSIGLVFIDGTQLSIGPSSQVIINRYLFSPKKKQYSFDVMIQNGSAIYSSGKLGELSPESIKVQTPEATIGVRGTKFLVEVD
ncbi:FecR domain-containing protein [Psychromonas sp. 14N.309.X.WAT.B.A12]|uniref:FecR family protein n=1 Tax=unclassified Psychromonas TaxID=2614957 RepID=UPI0025B13633|nr:FecR domain-containing protein [Psychromonas sp. 14N.309.X.WAT.B.A12]MDN2662283.1 FecR domain-containing protein [Psychromonas sp. 14N.309.X.WAT.B.A12]